MEWAFVHYHTQPGPIGLALLVSRFIHFYETERFLVTYDKTIGIGDVLLEVHT
jgi:hypothetical protein